MEQKLKCCKTCGKLKPVKDFYKIPRHKENKKGEKTTYYSLKVNCKPCDIILMRKYRERRSEKRENGTFSLKDDIEYFNHNDVKCTIKYQGGNNYRVSTKDIDMYYTHLVGLSGTLQMDITKALS